LQFFAEPEPVPAMTMKDIEGKEIRTTDWTGKVTILNFWATWCKPCQVEIPLLVRIQQQYKENLQVIGVALDESVSLVNDFVRARKINFTIVLSDSEIERFFPDVVAVPTTFLIDSKGRIVQKHLGELEPRMLEDEIRFLVYGTTDRQVEFMEQPTKRVTAAALSNQVPGVELSGLAPSAREQVAEDLNTQFCTCGCKMTIGHCRLDDSSCQQSLAAARKLVQAAGRR